MKKFISAIKAMFAAPVFHAGERVNHVTLGVIRKTDGFVVGQSLSGVLVEWPKGGSGFIPADELCLIG